jgi:hypothetical protein
MKISRKTAKEPEFHLAHSVASAQFVAGHPLLAEGGRLAARSRSEAKRSRPAKLSKSPEEIGDLDKWFAPGK